MNWSIQEYISGQVQTESSEGIWPRQLNICAENISQGPAKLGQLKWKCTRGIYSQRASPQWVLPRCRERERGRELTRDSGSVQHDLDAVSETADL